MAKPSDPVTDPSPLERLLFDAGLVEQVPLATIYDIKARTSIQRTWQSSDLSSYTSDIHSPAHWNNKLFASMRGEFFAWILDSASSVLDVGCGEGWPSLYLARNTGHVTGIDISPEHIRLARATASLLNLSNITSRLPISNNCRLLAGVFTASVSGAMCLLSDELPVLLSQAGFSNFACWGLPNAVEFAQSLAESPTLSRLAQEDLLPCLRALVRSAPRCQQWVHNWCSCVKEYPCIIL